MISDLSKKRVESSHTKPNIGCIGS